MSQHTARLPYHQLSPKAFMGLVNLSETIKKGPLGTRLASWCFFACRKSTAARTAWTCTGMCWSRTAWSHAT